MEMRAQNLLSWVLLDVRAMLTLFRISRLGSFITPAILKLIVMCNVPSTYTLSLGRCDTTHQLTGLRRKTDEIKRHRTRCSLARYPDERIHRTARLWVTISTQKKPMLQVTLYDPRRRRTTRRLIANSPRPKGAGKNSYLSHISLLPFWSSLRSLRQSLCVT